MPTTRTTHDAGAEGSPAPAQRAEAHRVFRHRTIQGQSHRRLDGHLRRGEPTEPLSPLRVKTVVGTDDFGSMYEVLRRRSSAAARERFPDFWSSTGHGQLNVALAVLRELEIDSRAVGLPKMRAVTRALRKGGAPLGGARLPYPTAESVVLPRTRTPLWLCSGCGRGASLRQHLSSGAAQAGDIQSLLRRIPGSAGRAAAAVAAFGASAHSRASETRRSRAARHLEPWPARSSRRSPTTTWKMGRRTGEDSGAATDGPEQGRQDVGGPSRRGFGAPSSHAAGDGPPYTLPRGRGTPPLLHLCTMALCRPRAPVEDGGRFRRAQRRF